VLDLCLPGKSGVDLVEIIKKQWPHLPIVVVTGVRDHDAFLRCLQAGAADFLIKPVKIGQLLQILEEVLHRQARFEESEDGIKGGQLTRDWIELTAPSEMEYLNRLQRFTDVLLLSHFPQDLRDDLRLAFEEIGRNAIEWGNRFDREKMVRISYCVFPDRIVLKFEDEGEGFIPQKLPDPTTDPVAHISGRKSEGKRPGGFGVYLVQKLMDDVVYSDRGNVVLMTKHLPGEA
jgi:serine/threonine-protein kinase RsbW